MFTFAFVVLIFAALLSAGIWSLPQLVTTAKSYFIAAVCLLAAAAIAWRAGWLPGQNAALDPPSLNRVV